MVLPLKYIINVNKLNCPIYPKRQWFCDCVLHSLIHCACFAADTAIAELIKEGTDSEEFMECLRCQQDLFKGEDTDKVCPYIEDCIGRREPILKVSALGLE